MADATILRMKDQSHGAAGKRFGEALRNRALSTGATLESLANAALVKEDRVVQWLSGWDIPSAEDMEALLPALNIGKHKPDVPAVYDRNVLVTPAGYSSEKLRVQAGLVDQLEQLRAAGATERLQIGAIKPFDKIFLELAAAVGKRGRKPLEEARTKIATNVLGHYMLREAITDPMRPEDSIARFVDLLCAYYDADLTELNNTIGFQSPVLYQWRMGKALPERENFEKLRGWVEQHFDGATARKVTHLFIKDALERHLPMGKLRNLPTEFWAWKLEITNVPDCRASPDQPSWGALATPIHSKQEYFTCVRRAQKMFRNEFLAQSEFLAQPGMNVGMLQLFESGRCNQATENAIIHSCEQLDATRAERGEPPLFDRKKFEQLPEIGPRAVEGGHAAKVTRRGRPPNATPTEPTVNSHTQQLQQERAPKAAPGEHHAEQFDTLGAMLKTDRNRGMVQWPASVAEFAALTPRDVAKIAQKASSYMCIPPGKVPAFQAGLKELHKDISAARTRE